MFNVQRRTKILRKDVLAYPSPLPNLETLHLSCHQIAAILCYLSRLINLAISFIKQFFMDKYVNIQNSMLVKCLRNHPLSSTSGNFHISDGHVRAIIPNHNKSGHIQSDFEIEITNDVSYSPSTNTCQASPIVMMKPHGAQFFTSHPATIFLPILIHLKANNGIICLCSDTEMGEKLNWQQLSPNDFSVCGSFIKIRASHFSFYTAIVNNGYPEASKMIHADIGGTLELPEVPGVEVIFPGVAVQYDIEATIKVMFADGPYDVDHDDPTANALAAPVIKLGPTGHYFNPESKVHEQVQVRLPLPSGKEILENCGRPVLTFWQSTSAEGQPLEWKLFQTEYTIDVDNDGMYSVYFSVHHFTFFRVLWSILDSVINEAKIGASFFYPCFEFYIVFQAFMSENEDDKTFGLCFLCHRMGSPLEGIGNYPIFVGSSGPRMATSCLLQIRVVSSIFEANTDFGEEVLTQQELFIGRPFDKQFACKYTLPNIHHHGVIGKVFIEKRNESGTVEPLFDFLLAKPRPGQEIPQALSNDSSQGIEEHDESWEGQLSKELATLLSIKTDQDLGDNAWEDIARALGYQALEIDMKFKDEVDPFVKLLDDYKKRGGNPNDFISAMYKIGRKEKVSEYEQKLRNNLHEDERDLDDDDSLNNYNGSISPSRTSSSSGVVLPAMAINNRKRRHVSSGEDAVPPGKLAVVAQKVLKNWKKLGRVLELDENQLRETEQDYENDGVQEQCYQMLLTWKERYPDNGHQTLFNALGKLHLNDVARQLYF